MRGRGLYPVLSLETNPSRIILQDIHSNLRLIIVSLSTESCRDAAKHSGGERFPPESFRRAVKSTTGLQLQFLILAQDTLSRMRRHARTSCTKVRNARSRHVSKPDDLCAKILENRRKPLLETSRVHFVEVEEKKKKWTVYRRYILSGAISLSQRDRCITSTAHNLVTISKRRALECIINIPYLLAFFSIRVDCYTRGVNVQGRIGNFGRQTPISKQ